MASFFEKLKRGMGIEESEKIEEIQETESTEETAASSPAPLQIKPTIEKKQLRKKRILKPKKIAVEESKDSSPAYLRSRSAVEEAKDSSPAYLRSRSTVEEATASSPISLQDKSAEEELPEIKAEEKKPSFSPITVEALTDKKNTETKEEWLEPEGELAIDVYQTETELVIQSAIAGVKPEDLDISMERDVITIRGNRQKPFEEKGDYFAQECYWGPFSREIILPAEVDPERIEAVMKDGILIIRIPKIIREKLRKIKVRM